MEWPFLKTLEVLNNAFHIIVIQTRNVDGGFCTWQALCSVAGTPQLTKQKKVLLHDSWSRSRGPCDPLGLVPRWTNEDTEAQRGHGISKKWSLVDMLHLLGSMCPDPISLVETFVSRSFLVREAMGPRGKSLPMWHRNHPSPCIAYTWPASLIDSPVWPLSACKFPIPAVGVRSLQGNIMVNNQDVFLTVYFSLDYLLLLCRHRVCFHQIAASFLLAL